MGRAEWNWVSFKSEVTEMDGLYRGRKGRTLGSCGGENGITCLHEPRPYLMKEWTHCSVTRLQ